jgi:hypothetical protein
MGALGALTFPWAAGAAAVTGGGYVGYKVATRKSPEERATIFLIMLRNDREFADKFWAKGGL